MSRRVAFERGPNALAAALEAYAASGRAVIDLTVSNPTRVGFPPAPLAEWLGATGEAAARYEPHALGLPAARSAVAADLGRLDGRTVDPDDVILTASTSEAYAALLKVVADPGDAVVVPRPSYPLLEHLARFEGLAVRPFDLVDEGAGRFRVDPESLAEAAGHRSARAVLAVSPNNPTGSYLHPEDLDALGATGLPVVVDEVFRHHPVRGAAPPVPSATSTAGNVPVVTLGGLSKHVGLPQAKLAWIELGGARSMRSELRDHLELVLDAALSVGTPVQHATASILAAGDGARGTIRRRVRQNLRAAAALTVETAVTLRPVEGGWYATFRLPRIADDDGWARSFLEEDGVWVHPGWLFDFDSGEARIVVSLLTECKPFYTGLSRIIERVQRHV